VCLLQIADFLSKLTREHIFPVLYVHVWETKTSNCLQLVDQEQGRCGLLHISKNLAILKIPRQIKPDWMNIPLLEGNHGIWYICGEIASSLNDLHTKSRHLSFE
jgi:hypothetical protein